MLGDAYRYTKGQESIDINAAIAKITNHVVREFAGSAQTSQETQAALTELGKQTISTPEAFLRAYKNLKAQLRIDQQRINDVTMDNVKAYYGRDYPEGNTPWSTAVPADLNFEPEVTGGEPSTVVAPMFADPAKQARYEKFKAGNQ